MMRETVDKEKSRRAALKSAKSKAGMATATAILTLRETENSLKKLPAQHEERVKLFYRSKALTLAVEEFERALDNLQRAIETY